MNVESEVRNSTAATQSFALITQIKDAEGRVIAEFTGDEITLKAGQIGRASCRERV